MATPGPTTITREMSIALPDEGAWGPAMKVLPSDRMRAFVIALLEQGGKNRKLAYMKAGYSGNDGTCEVNAYKLSHDPRIQAAIREEALNRMGSAGIAAVSYLVELIESDEATVKTTHRLRAAEMVMNRIGLHALTEHKVVVEHTLSEQEKIEKAVRLAKEMGMDPKELLGRIGIEYDPDETIDVEFEDVTEEHSSEGLEDLL